MFYAEDNVTACGGQARALATGHTKACILLAQLQQERLMRPLVHPV